MSISSYPNHSLGQHIVPFQLTFHKDKTVHDVLELIRKKIGSWPNSESIFVVDDNNKLIGEIEFRVLLASKSDKKLSDIMETTFDVLTDHSHQNTAINLAVKKGVESIPVTDKDGRFLGIVDAGQIFKIMHEEHIEKLMHFSGILNNETLVEGYKVKIQHVVKSRLPWLLLGLFGGALSTFIIKSYSETLEAELSLAFFIPVIVYMNAAVGNQAQTIFVRYSAFEKIDLFKSLIFELKVSLLVGFTLASVIFLFTAAMLGLNVALIVCLSMFFGVVSSALISTFIPWGLQKKGKDPAIGSGPFTTIIQDLISILIYFSIASVLI